MKKTIFAMLFIATICTLFSSCKDDEEDWNPDAPLYITGVDGNKNLIYNLNGELNAHQICMLDSIGLFWGSDTIPYLGGRGWTLACFANNRLDTINNRIIAKVGNLETLVNNHYIDCDIWPYLYVGKWYVIFDEERQCEQAKIDTLGYVPNEQRQAAYEQIAELWDSGDKKKMLEIFQNALTFIPCNGKEYKAYIRKNNIQPYIGKK